MSTKQVQDAVNQTGFRKDRSEWVTGDEPATLGQVSYITTLAQRLGIPTGEVIPPDRGLTKAQASVKIEELREMVQKKVAQSAGPSAPPPQQSPVPIPPGNVTAPQGFRPGPTQPDDRTNPLRGY